MGLDGMEVIAIFVVIALFVFVLKQFGICEPMSLEGKEVKSSRALWFVSFIVLLCVSRALSLQCNSR